MCVYPLFYLCHALLTRTLCPSASYNGTAIVQRSIEIGEPIIFVAMNYR